MSEWCPFMDQAPHDGTPIQARIAGYGSDNIIAWQEGFLNTAGDPCGCWVYMEGEPPDCWTDGVCWESNEDQSPSAPPIAWKLPQPPGLEKGDG